MHINFIVSYTYSIHLYLNTFRRGYYEGDDFTLAKMVEEGTDKVE